MNILRRTNESSNESSNEPSDDSASRAVRFRSFTAALIGALAFPVALGACGSEDAAREVSQTVEINAVEYAFEAPSAFTIEAGERVRFQLDNKGNLAHEMQILDDRGRLIDRVARLEPGASGAVEVDLDEAGIYQLICDIDDHLSRGQQARFQVDEATS